MSVESIGFQARDTTVLLPADAGLEVSVTLEVEPVPMCVDGVRSVPWWKFWRWLG